jgi:hypothetical protein
MSAGYFERVLHLPPLPEERPARPDFRALPAPGGGESQHAAQAATGDDRFPLRREMIGDTREASTRGDARLIVEKGAFILHNP